MWIEFIDSKLDAKFNWKEILQELNANICYYTVTFFFSALLVKYKIIVCFSLLNGKYWFLLLSLYHGELEMPQYKAFSLFLKIFNRDTETRLGLNSKIES